MSGFDGLVAAVTGGASGIGLAAAQHLTKAGARVAVLDLDPAPEGLTSFRCDVTDGASVRTAIDRVAVEFGRLDILINNAGIGAQGTLEDNPDEEWLRVFEVNVFGMVRVARAALPHLRKSPSPAIVNTASVASTCGIPQRALYSASKGAVRSLTLAMAADYVREGIRVNCVNPGTVDTPWVGRLLDKADDPEAERVALNARQPIGRMVSADEVADAIVYLASPANGASTGVELFIDGGMQNLRLRPQT